MVESGRVKGAEAVAPPMYFQRCTSLKTYASNPLDKPYKLPPAAVFMQSTTTGT